MSRLIETIKVLENRICHLSYHKQRIAESCIDLYSSTDNPISFPNIKKALLKLDRGLHKLRIVYDQRDYDFTITPYKRKEVRSLRKVYVNTCAYNLKFEDRTQLNHLYSQRGDKDDILIVKNGLVTDSFYANAAFKKGNYWFTPETPLLNGTKRQWLLDKGLLFTKHISEAELSHYSRCRLFNAMIDFGEIEFSTKYIF